MNKQTITIATILLALPLVFAMYGGESEIIPFGFETDNCTIVPNVTEGINFTFNGNEVLVEPVINFVGEFNITCYDWQTKEEETQQGSGRGSIPKDWSVKCGYNKECLYGKINQTEIIENKTEVLEEEPIELITEPIIQEEDKETPKGVIILLIIFVIIGVSLVGYLLWKIFKKDDEVYDYEKEENKNE